MYLLKAAKKKDDGSKKSVLAVDVSIMLPGTLPILIYHLAEGVIVALALIMEVILSIHSAIRKRS
jgi:hypothetical protein